ncbi:MAG: hypothetical protein ACRDLL_09260 [Solirubrobacterales bacterium]
MRPFRGALGLLTLALAFAAWPAESNATITFGSDLSRPVQAFSDTCILSTPPCTELLVGVHRANSFPAASPTDGVIVSFGIKTSQASNVVFRLGEVPSLNSGKARGAGTGPGAAVGKGTTSIPAHVPVKAGDFVGVDTSSVAAYSTACETGGREFTYHPTLAGSLEPSDSNSTCELLVNATVRPSSDFTFKKLKRDEDRGTAALVLGLPGPGGLVLSGKGIKRVSEHAAEAGNARIRIKPAGKAKRRLRNRGEATVKAKVEFTPDGGSARTKTKLVKLILKSPAKSQ